MSTAPNQSSLTTPAPVSTVNIGMVGLGTVGTGVFKLLSPRDDIQFTQIAVGNVNKDRNLSNLNYSILTTNALAVASHPDVHVVVEVMGGVDTAKDVVVTALKNGKHVITANKALIAQHSKELFQLANENNVCLLFEAAVAAGIPIIVPLKLSLAANNIKEIVGILNGTTNYILTKMADEGWTYDDALKVAQQKGFAEADPSSDVDGYDTAYKTAILASIANNQQVNMDDVHCDGITKITQSDLKLAESLGYAIKLVGLYRQTDCGLMDIRVQPMLIDLEHPLASIKNENNAIFVQGDAVGEVMFYGKGAGELPTASAVCADTLAVVSGLKEGNQPLPGMQIALSCVAKIQPVAETINRYFIRLKTIEKPGVIGIVGTACGQHQVSIDSIVQHGLDEDGSASVILVTQSVTEKQILAALEDMKKSDCIENVATMLRIL